MIAGGILTKLANIFNTYIWVQIFCDIVFDRVESVGPTIGIFNKF